MELPYWNRTGGRDHIWLISHDEGSCWAPTEIRSSIILSHWGRKVGISGLCSYSCADSCKSHLLRLPLQPILYADHASEQFVLMQALKHQSYTAYPDDNYSDSGVHPEWRPYGWRHIVDIEGHPCYDPDKVTAHAAGHNALISRSQVLTKSLADLTGPHDPSICASGSHCSIPVDWRS